MQVPLGADRVRFPRPGAKLSIDLGRGNQTEMMYMIAGGDGLDAAKPWVRQSTGQYEVTIQPVGARSDLSEGHADLKGDASLFRENGHRAACSYGSPNGLVERAHGRILPAKVVGEVIPAAGVRLIAVGEAAPASRARPQWGTGWGWPHRIAIQMSSPAPSSWYISTSAL